MIHHDCFLSITDPLQAIPPITCVRLLPFHVVVMSRLQAGGVEKYGPLSDQANSPTVPVIASGRRWELLVPPNSPTAFSMLFGGGAFNGPLVSRRM